MANQARKVRFGSTPRRFLTTDMQLYAASSHCRLAMPAAEFRGCGRVFRGAGHAVCGAAGIPAAVGSRITVEFGDGSTKASQVQEGSSFSAGIDRPGHRGPTAASGRRARSGKTFLDYPDEGFSH